MHTVLSVLAFVLVVLAALTQGVGIVRTWLDFGREGQRLRDVVAATLRRGADRVIAWRGRFVARVLRRHPVTIVVGQGALAFGASFDARGRIQYGALPSGTKAALAELESRTKDLMTRLTVEKESREDADRLAGQETAALRRDLGSEVERLVARDRRIATGGVGWGLAALFMTVLAAICQTLATVVS